MTKQSIAGEAPIEQNGEPTGKSQIDFGFLHGLYRTLWRIGGPLLPAYLRRRARRGKEDPARLDERFGKPSRPRPPGSLVWVHCASVGESLSALPLVERLLEQSPGLHILFTTGTVTSATMLDKRLPTRAFHQYVPLDHPRYVDSFLTHWHPDAVFWLESEFWPNLLRGVKEAVIPAALLNARLSDRSFNSWKKRPGFIAPVLGSFSVCLAQDENVAMKLGQLGAPRVSMPGNLKFAAPLLPDATEDRKALVEMIGSRPVILAAQTAPGEEVLLGRCLPNLKQPGQNPLLIIVPRHPERGPQIRQALGDLGLIVATRSGYETITKSTDVYLADTMGELGTFYRLEALVILGRSLVPGYGGSNLLEPARFGRCLIQGPWTENFTALNTLFNDAKASIIVDGEALLTETLNNLLDNPDEVARLGAAGEQVSVSAYGVIDRVTEALGPVLSKIGDGDARS